MNGSVVRFAVGRLLRLFSVLLAVSFLTFVLLNALPGSPVVTLLGPQAGNRALAAQVTRQLGLNHPLFVRYGIWLEHAVRGDLGYSYISNQPVAGTIAQRAPFTIELMLFAVLIALVVGVPLAIASARRPNGLFNGAVSGTTLALLAQTGCDPGSVVWRAEGGSSLAPQKEVTP